MSTVAVKLQVVPVGVTPFEGDLFERKLVAERLGKVVAMLPEGGAIAIDAPWGSGKTWFARNWQLELERDGHEVLYVDAFASDYVDDPFLMLAGELVTAAKKQQSTAAASIVEAGARVGKAILPATAKFVASAAGKWIAGEAASDKLVETLGDAVEGAGDLLAKQIEKKLAGYEAEKQSVVAFRESLTTFTAARTNPMVVLIDELDRCRPDFALRTIERIKHFFEVPKLVFVLLFNRSQLCASIQGAYGPNFDADGYLRKFLLFSLMLPKIYEQSSSDHNSRYCSQVLKAYGFPDAQNHLSFAE